MVLEKRSCLGCGASLKAGGLVCEYCGLSHILSGEGFAAACRACGAGNAPGGAGCVSCGADVGFDCPECEARLPLGSRFCSECRIELACYRHPKRVKMPNRVPADAVEEKLRAWLGSGWLRARDASKRVVVMDQSLTWLPYWSFEARFAGTVSGQQAQTHYRTVSREVPVNDPFDNDRGGVFDDDVFHRDDRPADFEGEDWFHITGRPPRRPRRGRSRGSGPKTRTKIVSEPYTVYQQVQKDFEESSRVLRAAASSPLYVHLTGSGLAAAVQKLFGQGGRAGFGEGVELGEVSELGGEALRPQLDEEAAFRSLKAEAAEQVKAGLLTRVETISMRCYQPSLRLIYTPVWSLIYRYKRARKKAWIDGARGEFGGEKVSVLAQWFG